nr:hypothetical protein [Tanacetum cinerariifolium]
MVKSSSSSENEPCCSKSCKKNTDSLNSKITELSNKLGDRENMLFHYKAGLAQVEARLAEHRNRELKYCEKIRVLEFKVESRADCIESLTKELELIKKEKKGLDSKLAGFQTASKDLDSLLKSQRLDKNKEGNNFVMKNKACFNCGDFDHLSYDCGLWVKKGRACLKNNYTHKSMPPRAVVHKTVRPPMRTTRPNMNAAQPKRTSIYKPAHSYLSRPVQRKSAVRTQS